MTVEECRQAEHDVEQTSSKPPIVIVFVSHAGLSKHELCNKLQDNLQDTANVIIWDTSKMEKMVSREHWEKAADRPGMVDGKRTVVVALKNAIPGNWERIAEYLGRKNAAALAVCLTDERSAKFPDTTTNETTRGLKRTVAPFAMPQVAMALHTVLLEYRPGSIQPDDPAAMRKAVGFASGFRGLTPAEMRDKMIDLFDDVLLLPVSKDPPSITFENPESKETQESLRQLLDLVEYGFLKGGKTTVDCMVPHLTNEWERSVLRLLKLHDVQRHLESLRVPADIQLEELSRFVRRYIDEHEGEEGEIVTRTAQKFQAMQAKSSEPWGKFGSTGTSQRSERRNGRSRGGRVGVGHQNSGGGFGGRGSSMRSHRW